MSERTCRHGVSWMEECDQCRQLDMLPNRMSRWAAWTLVAILVATIIYVVSIAR
jgi:hypothetical protein